MAETLTAVESQDELDGYLDREYRLPVEISSDAPLPAGNKHYQPLRELARTGLRFTLRELLHAVGCKTAALPMSSEDQCLRVAYILLVALDLREPHLCFRADVESDFQAPRSQEVGVGVTCLIASKHLGVPWDQLGPIPGRGKRFDYRAKTSALSCILEAKGTKYRDYQRAQIQHGIEKKELHRAAGESYDVELIVSTHVGGRSDRPRVLLADPLEENYEWAFSEQGDKFFRLRHYSRVMQFIGATEIARLLYLDSNDLRFLGLTRGQREQLNRILSGEIQTFEIPPGTDRIAVRRTEDGARASVFEDGSAFFVLLRERGDNLAG